VGVSHGFSIVKIKKRATYATLSIIRVHLIVLVLLIGVRAVTPYFVKN
jgi:hypothetical protein